MIEIIRANNSGFCYGVRKAIGQVYDEIEKAKVSKKKIYLFGKLIHNDKFIEELISQGVVVLDDSAIDDDCTEIFENIDDNSVVILRAHGVSKKIYQALKEIQHKNIEITDTTCGDVKKIHKLVTDNTNDGTLTVILGDKSHPEIKGVKSYVKGRMEIYKDFGELETKFCGIKEEIELNNKKLIVLSQTTHNIDDYNNCKDFIKGQYDDAVFFDTICNVTEKRQTEAADISKNADMMIVVGGTKSSNTKKLYEICKKNCENTFIVETSEHLPLYILQNLCETKDKEKGAVKVGITAGASTPDRIIKEVETRIMAEDNIKEAVNSETEMSFQEMLDASDSFVILNRGSKVKGTISSISPGEIHVDLGTKHTGILSFDEITDDSSVKLSEMFKVGDEIETQVIKINDVEGTALLSKKRVDSTENWEKIVQYYEDGTIIEGKIVQVVNGGLITLADAAKLFVPASQANVSKDTDLQTLINKKVRMKIIDINLPKHRAIASIRAAYNDERKASEDKIWGEIEIGKKYRGVVKSIVNYGAFVDIGGVDGMVHTSELSWSRIKHPSEVVKLGDEVEVYIKQFDAEKRRISLGYKDENANPWTKFLVENKVGDALDVKILNMMPFGAFAELFPGVDGLIHISQISDKKISKPAEILNVGEIVKAKITDINEAEKKISLSIRALIEGDTPTLEESIEAAEAQAQAAESEEAAALKAEAVSVPEPVETEQEQQQQTEENSAISTETETETEVKLEVEEEAKVEVEIKVEEKEEEKEENMEPTVSGEDTSTSEDVGSEE